MPRVCTGVAGPHSCIDSRLTLVAYPHCRATFCFVFFPLGFRGATTNLTSRETKQGTREPALRCLLIFMLARMTTSALSQVATLGALFSRHCVALLLAGHPQPPIVSVDTPARPNLFLILCGCKIFCAKWIFWLQSMTTSSLAKPRAASWGIPTLVACILPRER